MSQSSAPLPDPTPRDRGPVPRRHRDAVDRAGEGSFPASDPPCWTLSAALPDPTPAQRARASRRALDQQLRALCGQ